MKRFFVFLFALAVCLTCSCDKNKPEGGEEPAAKEFKLDSWNGKFVQGLSDSYENFEATGSLLKNINVEGLTFNKGKYIIAGCILLEKILAEPDTWQDEDIDIPSAAYGELMYQHYTCDPAEIDFAHVRYLASRVLAYTKENNGLPNYVTFPSGDTSSPGYLPQMTIVVTKHDNEMNLRAYMVVIARLFNYFVKHEGEWPEKISSWPATYLDSTSNCPIDDPVVLAARDAALAGVPADATERQKAEAIYYYVRDNFTWILYSNTKRGAVQTIKDKTGNCCDLTHATVAMCRAAGIRARYLHGQCYFGSSTEGEGHVIPEIFVDDQWWICDPYKKTASWGKPTWKGMQTFNGRYNELEF